MASGMIDRAEQIAHARIVAATFETNRGLRRRRQPCFGVEPHSFLVCAHVETLILAGERPTIWWQILAYALMTAGEVLISVTSLEFFYTQAPLAMKSAIMAIKMFAVSLGNLVAAGVNFAITNPDGSSMLDGETYFLFFAGMLIVNGLIFIPVARAYQVRNYMQGNET